MESVIPEPQDSKAWAEVSLRDIPNLINAINDLKAVDFSKQSKAVNEVAAAASKTIDAARNFSDEH